MRHLERGEFSQAYRALGDAVVVAKGDDIEFLRGLRHAAAAGVKQRHGDARGAERQRRHAERRLDSYRPSYRGVDVDSVLAAMREADGGNHYRSDH